MIHPVDTPSPEYLAADPLADLLLNLVALILLAMLALLPALQAPPSRPVNPARLVAAPDGLIFGPRDVRVPTGQITIDPDLRRHLATLRNDGVMPRVVVFADGLEAAFELESVLAGQGFQQVYQVRLDRSCSGSPGQRVACLASLP